MVARLLPTANRVQGVREQIMKSHVSMEQKVCLICRQTYDTNAILLDTRMKDSLERHTITGPGTCKECVAMNDKGYIALVGASNPSSDGDKLQPEDATYTGEVCWLKRHAAEQIIDTDLTGFNFVYIEPEAILKLKKAMGRPVVNGSGP